MVVAAHLSRRGWRGAAAAGRIRCRDGYLHEGLQDKRRAIYRSGGTFRQRLGKWVCAGQHRAKSSPCSGAARRRGDRPAWNLVKKPSSYVLLAFGFSCGSSWRACSASSYLASGSGGCHKGVRVPCIFAGVLLAWPFCLGAAQDRAGFADRLDGNRVTLPRANSGRSARSLAHQDFHGGRRRASAWRVVHQPPYAGHAMAEIPTADRPDITCGLGALLAAWRAKHLVSQMYRPVRMPRLGTRYQDHQSE
jgi:hypothetical protein